MPTPHVSPWQHPVVRFLGWVLGCYVALTFAQRLSPLHWVIAATCGAMATTIYLLRFRPQRLVRPYAMPWLGGAIDWVARVSGEQPPTNPWDAAAQPQAATTAGDASSPLVPETPSEYALLLHRLQHEVRGHDRVLERLVRSLRQTAELRVRASDRGAGVPLGIHLLVGAKGTGKRFLAARLAAHLYRRGGGTVVDATGGGEVIAPIVDALRANPAQVIVVEAADQLAPEGIAQLVAAAAGAPLVDPVTGMRATAWNAVIILLVHRDAGWLSTSGVVDNVGTGQTQLLDQVSSELGVDRRLAWALNGAHPMCLPEPLVVSNHGPPCPRASSIDSPTGPPFSRSWQHSLEGNLVRSVPRRWPPGSRNGSVARTM
ncbi:MAG: hypothetical protein IPK85_05275 [Gemmatimonadetes bacterium]|nr:hypothetical protein [Gemmatimonadota bacterium]